MSNQITIRLSSSALSTGNCMQNFKLVVADGYRGLESASGVYGSSIHKFIQTMYVTKDSTKAVLEAKKRFNVPKTSSDDKNKQHLFDEKHMISVCYFVWMTHIQDDNLFEVIQLADEPAVERTFSIPYYEDEFIKVILEGTIDAIGKFVNGCYAIRDFKTTSFWDKKKFLKNYEMSKQLRFYRWICKLMSVHQPDSILGKIGVQRIGAFVDAIFIKPDCNATEVVRSEVYQYTDYEVDEFTRSIDWFIQKLSLAVRNDYFPKEGILNGTCQNKYGICSFWNVCRLDKKVGEMLLKRDFKVVPYTPLDYNGYNQITMEAE